MSTDSPSIPRFIMGMSRGGTTWMCRSLNTHSEVAAFGETWFWGRLHVKPDAEGMYDQVAFDRVVALLKECRFDSTVGKQGVGWMKNIKREDLSDLIDESVGRLQPPVSVVETFCTLARAIARAEGKPHWVEKTPNHLIWADRIFNQLPDARAVIMLRDPYAFMLSSKHQQDRGDAARREKHARRYHPLGCALVWRSYLRAALALAEQYPDQVKLVRLDDVQENPEKVLMEVQEFLLLELDPNIVALPQGENSSFENQPKPSVSGSEVFWMNRVAQRDMIRAQYDVLPVSRDPVGFAESFATLPRWLFRTYVDLQKRSESASPVRYVWRWLSSG